MNEVSTQIPTPESASAPAPALWNPNAAASWSILFSPIFGAYLQGINAKALGRLEEAAAHQKWVYGYLAYLGYVLISVLIPALAIIPTNLIGIVLLLTWYFTLGAKQAKFVKDTYGEAYPRKSWQTPLLIGFAGVVCLFIVAFILGFISVMLHGRVA